MKGKRVMCGLAALTLVCLPLIAQETAPEVPPQAVPSPTPQPTQQAVASPADDAPETASQQSPDPPGERISADNNLSFPVDI